MSNNFIKLKGRLNLENAKTFTSYGEQFVEYKLEVARNSGVTDILPIVSKNNIGISHNKFVEIIGELRTRNELQDGKNRLIITVFAKEVRLLEGEEYANEVELQGFICKPPILRELPNDENKTYNEEKPKRLICDMLLAVNNKYGRSYYIPTISFNRDATFVSTLLVGTEISVSGKLQSRNYQKNIDGQIEERTVIELCIKNLSNIEKGE